MKRPGDALCSRAWLRCSLDQFQTWAQFKRPFVTRPASAGSLSHTHACFLCSIIQEASGLHLSVFLPGMSLLPVCPSDSESSCESGPGDGPLQEAAQTLASSITLEALSPLAVSPVTEGLCLHPWMFQTRRSINIHWINCLKIWKT